MATNKYSLSDYQLVVTINAPSEVNIPGITGSKFSIGGDGGINKNGSFLGLITVSRAVDAWTTETDATGSWVHNRNLAKAGTISVNITQISDSIVKLMQVFSLFEEDDSLNDLSLQVVNLEGKVMVDAESCLIQKPSDLNLGETAEKQAWTFTCGKITYNY